MGNILNSVTSGVQDIVAHPTDIGKHWDDFTKAEGQIMTTKNYANWNGDNKPDAPEQVTQMAPTSSPEQAYQQYQNVQQGLDQQQEFLGALRAQHGVANQGLAFQNAQNMANGVGPNPAMAQLANSTGQNVANQAALMAGQRGAGANAGLMARQAANQGANIQQQGAGQGALLQAQQQVAGQQQMANIANMQAANQGQATGAYNQYAQGAQQNILNSIQGNQSTNASLSNAAAAAKAAKYTADKQADTAQQGGLISGLGSAAALLLAKGGEVPTIGNHGPRSEMSKHLSQAKELKSGGAVPGHAQAPGNSYSNDTVKAMLSPGEVVIPRSVMQSKNPAEAAKQFVAAVLARHGAKK